MALVGQDNTVRITSGAVGATLTLSSCPTVILLNSTDNLYRPRACGTTEASNVPVVA